MSLDDPHYGARYYQTLSAREPLFSPTCFWNAPLPDNVKLDDPSNPMMANDLVRQKNQVNPYINTLVYSAQPLILPADQPLVPVLWRGSTGSTDKTKLKAALEIGGVPIPSDWVGPQNDSDRHAVFYQPEYVSPWDGRKGRYFELYHVAPEDPTTNSLGARWSCTDGARYVRSQVSAGHANSWEFSGYQYTNPGSPHSTYQHKLWGATASSIPILPGMVLYEDVMLGAINHALGLSVIDPRNGTRWPAMENDGRSTSASPIQEGMRMRFLSDAVMPTGLHPLAQLVWKAVRDYGLVVWDKAGSISFRAEPKVGEFFNGTAGYQILSGFPWQDLKVLAVGSDTTPNPLS